MTDRLLDGTERKRGLCTCPNSRPSHLTIARSARGSSCSAYQTVRSDPLRFIVGSGHQLPEFEDVVEDEGSYLIEKHPGEATDIARALTRGTRKPNWLSGALPPRGSARSATSPAAPSSSTITKLGASCTTRPMPSATISWPRAQTKYRADRSAVGTGASVSFGTGLGRPVFAPAAGATPPARGDSRQRNGGPLPSIRCSVDWCVDESHHAVFVVARGKPVAAAAGKARPVEQQHSIYMRVARIVAVVQLCTIDVTGTEDELTASQPMAPSQARAVADRNGHRPDQSVIPERPAGEDSPAACRRSHTKGWCAISASHEPTGRNLPRRQGDTRTSPARLGIHRYRVTARAELPK